MDLLPTRTADFVTGYLYKWTNYVKGYQKRYFVLENGFISYYRNEAEVSNSCRGTLNLRNATIEVHSDNLQLVISKHGTATFHLKAFNDKDHKRWTDALKTASSKLSARRSRDYDSYIEDDDAENEDDLSQDFSTRIERSFNNFDLKLNALDHCQRNLNNKFEELNRAIKDLELISYSDSNKNLENVRDKATIFNVSSLAAFNSYKSFSNYSRKQLQSLNKIFNTQKDRQQRLDTMIEDLAKQLRNLENHVESRHYHASALQLSPKISLMNHIPRKLPGCARAVDKESTIAVPDLNKSYSEDASNSDDDEVPYFDAQETFSVTLPLTYNRSEESLNASELGDYKEKAGGYESDVSIDFDPDAEDDDERNQRKQIDKSYKAKQVKVMTTKSKSTTLTPFVNADPYKSVEMNSANFELKLIPLRTPLLRRTCIPPRPNYSLNLWSIMRNCIGKELSKIPMPVNFSEPISMLQRLTEDFQYSFLLDRAASCTDSLEALAYVAAFTVSAYASTAIRTSKPFNPILGETYECDRTDDLGWRSLAEQISHHPPKAALHCESNLWESWFEFSMTSKFRGKYLQILPIGTCHLRLRKSGHHYTWHKIPMTVHNIIVGKLWIDNSGDMDIVNHSTGEKCHLSYAAYSFFANDVPKRVKGAVTRADGSLMYVLSGTWDQFIECSQVISSMRDRNGKETVRTGTSIRLWEVEKLSEHAESMYNFSKFAITLNDANEKNIAPTDCRLRPDQRLMEEGRWDDANLEKLRLEEKQRDRRRNLAYDPQQFTTVSTSPTFMSRKSKDSTDNILNCSNELNTSYKYPSDDDNEYKPLWFERGIDQDTNEFTSFFNHKYWKLKLQNNWNCCPDLF